MRLAARVDENQEAVVAALRRIGASVQPLNAVGKGVPDLLVGYRGRNWLFEVKNSEQVPSKRRLTDDEFKWHQHWSGQVTIVQTPEQAVAILNQLAALAIGRTHCNPSAMLT